MLSWWESLDLVVVEEERCLIYSRMRIRSWHVSDTRSSTIGAELGARVDVFFRLTSAFTYCLFSLWFRRFMFCILLHVSRVPNYVFIHASVTEPAWQKSHKGKWVLKKP